ncbi:MULTISPECIES: hypothetical protein [Vibrio]|uniref:hypothetical protein n=1 Tax=Vibrio TaxID=662 RepID=UPI0012DB5C4D|nr:MULTISPECIES: hypothetical protein [Vibrio]USD53600.1 hypothetical protein J4N44_09745 [Vibrio sp. SCSIO 43155]
MSKKSSSRAKLGKPIKVTFGVKQVEEVSNKANSLNLTPRDFVTKSGLDAADKLLDAKA